MKLSWRLWLTIGVALIVLFGGGGAWLKWGVAQPAAAWSSQPAPSAAESVAPSEEPTAAASVSPSTSRKPSARSSRKGVSVWAFSGLSTALTDVGAGWYYNWASAPTPGAGSSAEFVPMIWGPASVNSSELNKAKASGKALLGFNEPDFANQANLTVAKALELWPQLQSTGLRLGSPAVAVNAAKAGGWLDQFMAGVHSKGLKVDFITLHWYGSDFSDAASGQLKSYIQAVWDRYHLPIWLTEFALIKFSATGSVYPSDSQQVNFINKATAMLRSLSYVEKYAWFALPTPKEGQQGTGLYRTGTSPTPEGLAYRSAT